MTGGLRLSAAGIALLLPVAAFSHPASSAPRDTAASRLVPTLESPSLPILLEARILGGAVFDGRLGTARGRAGSWGIAPPVAGAPVLGVPHNGVILPRVAFSGQGPVSVHLVKAIAASQVSIKLALYDFSLQDVLEALQRAARRAPAVRIQIVLDEGHVFPRGGRRRSAQIEALLAEPGIETRMIRGLGSFGIMHNKVAVFDDVLMETGSYNWGRAAETVNFENAIFSDQPERVRAFAGYWAWIWQSAYSPSEPGRGPPTMKPGPPPDLSRPVPFRDAPFPGSVFSPLGGTAEWILKAIRLSRVSIDIALFNFSNMDIAAALLERKQNGVAIRLVLDRGQAGNSAVIPFLRENGFDMRVMDGRAATGDMHHKFAVFDGAMAETGAYNWSFTAENYSFENVSFLDDPADVGAFRDEFGRLWAKALVPTAEDLHWEGPHWEGLQRVGLCPDGEAEGSDLEDGFPD